LPISLSVMVFSKDRPLFMDTHLGTLAPTVAADPLFDVTVLWNVSMPGMEEAYADIQRRHPWAKFVREARREDVVRNLRAWLDKAGEMVMVSVDDNICSGKLDTEAIRIHLADGGIFGFTLRLSPGIRNTQDGNGRDPGPPPGGHVIVYEPAKYGLPWNYVWEMSSTFFRKGALRAVLDSYPIASVNDLESYGLSKFPARSVGRMACFGLAPVTNIFVDSWLSQHCVSNPVSNAAAFELYKKGAKIDVEETFRERDRQAITHVKKLFLKS